MNKMIEVGKWLGLYLVYFFYLFLTIFLIVLKFRFNSYLINILIFTLLWGGGTGIAVFLGIKMSTRYKLWQRLFLILLIVLVAIIVIKLLNDVFGIGFTSNIVPVPFL